MSVEETIEDLFSSDELTAEKILNLLLESDKHLNMKTHIENPPEMAILEMYIEHLSDIGLTTTAKNLRRFMKNFKEFMVSYKRKSREEIRDALIALREQKTGARFSQKLLGMGNEK